MCMGLPMRVLEAREWDATVEGCGERRVVSLLWTGPVPVGAPLLVHQDRAVRVLDEAEVAPLLAALEALQTGVLPDDGPPQLPPHLRPDHA